MTQPEFVPLAHADKVRATETLPPAKSWRSDRPGDLSGPGLPVGDKFGSPAPDLGYGLKLVRTVVAGLSLTHDDHAADVEAALFAIGCKRASIFGRAPVIHDFAMAATLFGFWVGAPVGLVSARRALFAGAGHEYSHQRKVADAVPETTLRLNPGSVVERLAADWSALIPA